ncbi:MAG TPA: GWxTD domain-containing protein [Bacteroidia bacterium]|nr:GWxTD domain-containing protein [Bacteroidia bacterium]
MKHKIKSLIFAICIVITALSANAKSIKAYLMMSEFIGNADGNFVETYLNVNSKSIIYAKNEKGKFQASIGVNILFTRNDSVFAYEKYNLLSPEYDDTLTVKPNFIDVQRFLLKNGQYTFELSITDNNNITKPFNYNQIVIVDLNPNVPSVASIELIDSYKKADSTSHYSKNGFDIVPYVSSYFPESISELTFYTEIYAIDRDVPEGETVIINSYLEAFENGVKIQDFFRFSRAKSSKVIPLLGSLNIKTLPSGNYNFVIEARDKENKLIADQRLFVQRNNPKVEANLNELNALNVQQTFVEKMVADSLNEYIKCLRPISSRIEVDYANNVVAAKDLLNKKQYFLSFWIKRNQLNPEQEWNIYYARVKEANRLFKTQTRKGYATDRGRVWLQYGKPDSRLVYDREPSLYPYELWQYYKLNNRTNRRFVFTNTDLVSNNYYLIHSDAIGEVRDDRWQTRLNKRNNMYQSFDQEKATDQFGTNLRDAYDISR